MSTYIDLAYVTSQEAALDLIRTQGLVAPITGDLVEDRIITGLGVLDVHDVLRRILVSHVVLIAGGALVAQVPITDLVTSVELLIAEVVTSLLADLTCQIL